MDLSESNDPGQDNLENRSLNSFVFQPLVSSGVVIPVTGPIFSPEAPPAGGQPNVVETVATEVQQAFNTSWDTARQVAILDQTFKTATEIQQNEQTDPIFQK